MGAAPEHPAHARSAIATARNPQPSRSNCNYRTGRFDDRDGLVVPSAGKQALQAEDKVTL